MIRLNLGTWMPGEDTPRIRLSRHIGYYRAIVKDRLAMWLLGYNDRHVKELMYRVNQIVRWMPPQGSQEHVYQMAKLCAPSIKHVIWKIDPKFAERQGYQVPQARMIEIKEAKWRGTSNAK